MLKYLIEKEFKQIYRNSFLPRLILIMPVMMLIIMPWAANQEITDIKLSVVDHDHSTYSDRLIRKIAASKYFLLTNSSPTGNKALNSIEKGEAGIILEIPQDFEKDLINGKTGNIMISANSVNGTKGGLSTTYLSTILSNYADELRNEITTSATADAPTFTVIPRYKFNQHLDYKIFMVPALMVMLLTMMTGFLPALNIVSEKETGTIEQINVTPVKKITFVLSKLIPYWIIGFIVLSICIALATLIYGIYPTGSLFTIYIFAAIYILVVSGMGLIISNHSETMQQAMFVMYFFIMILILMSGLFTPINSMPEWAQILTTINPLKYFIQVMRQVYLKGSTFHDLTNQFLALCIFALVLNTWAVLSYKKSK